MSLPTPQEVLLDLSTSHWLRGALISALERDPVDAANDAATLAAVLNAHANSVIEQALTASKDR